MFFFNKKANLINLLYKTLSIVQKKDRKGFIYLIFLLIVQALLEVISIASIIPLLYLLESEEDIISRINIFLSKYGIQSNFVFDKTLLMYIPLIVIFIMIIATMSRLFIVYRTNNFIEETRYSISSRLMNKYILNNYNSKVNTSELAKSLLSEIDQFIILVFQPVMWMVTNIILLIGILIYLFYTNLKASIVSSFLLGFFYLLFYLFTKEILNLQGIKSEQSNKGRFKTAIEIFQSIKDIKIYSSENFFANRFKRFSKEFANTNSIYSTLIASPKYFLEMIVFIGLAITILFLTFNNSISLESIPLLGTFAFAAYKAQPALSNVIYGINSLIYGSKIIDNLSNELNIKSHNFQRPMNLRRKSNLKGNSCIITKNLTYKYQNNGIENINIEINFPSLFIIAGESGSGKSTLLNLISGLQQPQYGEVFFNERIFKNKKPKISYLHQDHSLFDASVAENIAFGIEKENIDYELIIKVLQEARMFNYVSKLEDSFNTKVGEKGNNLSVGQIQRLSIARALYFQPQILILDEPTSGLDKENAEELIQTLINISNKITVIVSTHQLNYFPQECDVFFIDK